MVFLMVWIILNQKITTKFFSKIVKGEWNDDENAKKHQKLIFFIIFSFAPIMTARVFLYGLGHAEHENHKEKIIKKCLGAAKQRQKCQKMPYNWILSIIFTPKTFSLRFWWWMCFLMVWSLLNTKTTKQIVKTFLLAWKCIFRRRFAAPKFFFRICS